MNDMRQLFDAAIGVSPPSTIDIDALIRRQRKMTWVRRWAKAGGAATAVGGIAVAGTLGFAGGGFLGPPDPEPSPHAVVGRFDPAAAKRLGEALQVAMEEQLPDAEFLPHRRQPFTFRDEEGDSYLSDLVIRDENGVGSFMIVVTAARRGPTECDDNADQDGIASYRISCEAGTWPGGERVVAVTGDDRLMDRNDSRRIVGQTVFVHKPDGTSISIWVRNFHSTKNVWGPGEEMEPTATRPPMTIDQMVAVALDPGLTLVGAKPADLAAERALVRRLERALQSTVTREMPGFEFTAARSGSEPFGLRPEDGNSYLSDFDATDSRGSGMVMVVVTPERVPMTCDGRVDQDGLARHRVSCRVMAGPGGETVVVVSADDRDQDRDDPNRIRSRMVFVTKPDGTAVKMWARNVSTAALRAGDREPTRPDAPLSADAMVRIALDPRLTLKP